MVNEQASLNLASELLGHTDPKVTIEHYIRRNEHVNPLTAELLDAAFASSHQDDESEPGSREESRSLVWFSSSSYSAEAPWLRKPAAAS